MTTLALMEEVQQRWVVLTTAQQIFYGIGILAGLSTLLLAVLAIFGIEHHDAVDALDADFDHGGGGIFSIKPLTGFFLGFGWGGGIALSSGLSVLAATACGFGAGAAIMAVIVLMFRAILGMKSDGTMRINEAVGAIGTVYITLPASKASGGQVMVKFSGRQETFAALNASDRVIPSGEKIKVLSIVDGQTVLVGPLG